MMDDAALPWGVRAMTALFEALWFVQVCRGASGGEVGSSPADTFSRSLCCVVQLSRPCFFFHTTLRRNKTFITLLTLSPLFGVSVSRRCPHNDLLACFSRCVVRAVLPATILSAELALDVDTFTWDEGVIAPVRGPVHVLSIPTLNGDMTTGHALFAVSTALLVSGRDWAARHDPCRGVPAGCQRALCVHVSAVRLCVAAVVLLAWLLSSDFNCSNCVVRALVSRTYRRSAQVLCTALLVYVAASLATGNLAFPRLAQLLRAMLGLISVFGPILARYGVCLCVCVSVCLCLCLCVCVRDRAFGPQCTVSS